MRTNIELDDRLVTEAMRISKLNTKKDVVNEALKQFVAALKRKEILTLRGEDTWEGNLKQMREL
ncbi:MAG TPA: type II toxin-antitoxin system VapB family antitoxin [Pseudosphingobacterium sp.]|nr:type II toxin-antitoxin system VapB family antitoxin [Pseudosphingobacterium sp.]